MIIIFSFFIGVWSQPIRLHAGWKARGINTLVRYEADGGAATQDQFLASAKANGLNVWMQLDAMRPQDWSNPIISAIVLADEPDGVGSRTAAQMKADYDTARAGMATAGRVLPVFLDCDGNKIPYNPLSIYTAYAQACDVLGEDVYPENMHTSGGIADIANRVKTLQTASNGKPVVAVIESSDQDLKQQQWTQGNDATGTPLGPKMRGPTSDEFAQEVQTAVDAGVVGIIYFPDKIGQGWEGFDGTPPDVAARMTAVNVMLATKTVTITVPALPVAPAPVPPPAPPVAYMALRDLKHNRYSVAVSAHDTRLLTDPADVAAVDALLAKAK